MKYKLTPNLATEQAYTQYCADCQLAWKAYCEALERSICHQHKIPYTDKPNDPSDHQRLYSEDGDWFLETTEEGQD